MALMAAMPCIHACMHAPLTYLLLQAVRQLAEGVRPRQSIILCQPTTPLTTTTTTSSASTTMPSMIQVVPAASLVSFCPLQQQQAHILGAVAGAVLHQAECMLKHAGLAIGLRGVAGACGAMVHMHADTACSVQVLRTCVHAGDAPEDV